MECKYCQMELAGGIRHAWLKKERQETIPRRGVVVLALQTELLRLLF